MPPDDREQKECILALAEDVLKMARMRVPRHWNRLSRQEQHAWTG